MPDPEKPYPQREQPEPDPRRPDRIVNPGDELDGDGTGDEHEITQRTPRLTDELVVEEVIDDDDAL